MDGLSSYMYSIIALSISVLLSAAGALGNVLCVAQASSGISDPPYESMRAPLENGAVLVNYRRSRRRSTNDCR